jgi:hypothetical protein
VPGEEVVSLGVVIDTRCSVQRPIRNRQSAMRNRECPPIFLAIALLTPAPERLTAQNEKPPPATAAPIISAEDKEILKYRDLLENFELLQNLEKIKYLDFFTEKKARKSGAKPPSKENARKDSNATPKPK